MVRMLTLSFARGCVPDKWLRRYAEIPEAPPLKAAASDDPVAELLAGECMLALVRLPDPRLEAELGSLHKVELYQEEPGIAVSAESVFAQVRGPMEAADVRGEVVHSRPRPDGRVDCAEVAQMLSVVAAGVGVVLAPRPLLELLARQKVVALGIADPAEFEFAPTRIALVWRKADDSADVQDFVGITRGRSPRSSRATAVRRERSSAKRKGRVSQGQRRRGRKPRPQRRH